ncbi:MAG: porin family protein [Proteobacteria bacterium]|nr:porin family protein [Pseudomonadota bacterium]
MKKLNKILLSLLILSCFIASNLQAEIIILENNDILQGKITRYSKDTITIETEKETLELPTSNVRLIDYLSSAQKYQTKEQTGNKFLLYLKNGEIIEGIITQFTNEFLTIESPEGYGVLQIPISSVNFLTTGRSHIELNQRDAIGYSQKRSTLDSSSGLTSYASNQLSYKFFLSKEMFGNILLAYGNVSYGSNKLQLLSMDYRMGLTFKKVQNILLYYGGSIGYMQIKDDTQNIEGTGTGYGAFIGAEIFFPSLPNFGFSGELGYSTKKVDDYESTDLSISSFPAFSIHYYF